MWRLRLRGAGQAARRKTGQVRRERAGRWELYYYHTLTCSSGLVAGGPGQAAAGQVARQGRAPVQWSRARPRLCGLQQISLALVTGTAQLQVTQTPPQAQDWFHSGQAARLLLLALPEKWPTRNEVYYQEAGIR